MKKEDVLKAFEELSAADQQAVREGIADRALTRLLRRRGNAAAQGRGDEDHAALADTDGMLPEVDEAG